MIFSGGNVGIATTTDAGFKLDVNGTGRFRASAATYAGGSLILTSSAGTNPVYLTSNGGYFALSNGGGGDHLLITSTGAATFSSSVSATFLELNNISALGSGRVTLSSNGTRFGFFGTGAWALGNGTTNFAFGADAGNGFQFAVNGSSTPSLTITSSGNVLVGSSTDGGQKLQVTGNMINNVGNNVLVHRVTGATTGYNYGYWTNTSGSLLYGIEGSTPAQLQTGSTAYDAVITTANATGLSIGVNQLQYLRISSTGVFTFNSTGTASGAFISSAITPYWSFQSSAASATGYVGFGNSLITGAAATDFIIRSDNALKFAIGGTAAVTIGGGQLTLNGATSAFMQIVGTTTYSYTQYSSGTNTMYLLQNQNGVSTNGSTVGAAYFYMSNSQDFQFNWLGTTKATITSAGNLTIVGALSKGSGSFRIEHPLPSLSETHHLVHSFIEGPQADLIYRGKLTLVNGKAQANIDEVATMTDGTFEVLCREVQCFTTNESGWDLVKGKVIGNIIYIESQNENSTDEISWMVIGERKDKHMMDTEWTDEDGKVIVEPLKPIEPEPNNNLE
jgi:hypothetical protein